MPTTGTILQPFNGDTVPTPVKVVVGYESTANFTLTCYVGMTAESSPQMHNGTGIHNTNPDVAAAAGVNQTVYAKDGMNELAKQPGVNVNSNATPPPVTVGPIVEPNPGPVALGMVAGNRVEKKRRVSGECAAAINAAYVICRIYEVNVTTGQHTLVAAGADTVVVNNGNNKHEWRVEVKFQMDPNDAKLQYVARTTAYDKDDKPLGVQSKHFTK